MAGIAHAVFKVSDLGNDFSDVQVLKLIQSQYPKVFSKLKGIVIPPGTGKIIATAYSCACGNNSMNDLACCRRYVTFVVSAYLST
jgi:hypothetical protein